MSTINVCHGCLSFDRKLALIEKHENLYQELLLIKLPNTRKIKFCWECLKVLKNIHNFRLKITAAQKMLASGPLILCDSLSSLSSVTKVNDYATTLIEDEEKKEKTPIKIQIEVKQEELDTDDKFEMNNVTIDHTGKEHKELKEILKDEVKSEDEIDLDDIGIDENDVKQECDEIVPVKKKNIDVKKKRQRKGVTFKMKYKAIIMKDISLKDKRHLYDKVKIDSETVKQWMERKRQQTSKKKFQCQLCYCGFAQQKYYDQHMEMRHAKRAGRYECDVCRLRAPSLRALAPHVRAHFEQFACRLCAQTFATRGEVYLHFAHGPHARLNECRKCGLRFDCRKRKEFFDHYMNMHKYCICDICGKKYVKKKHLARHISYRHTINHCKICDKSYSSVNSLKNHIRRKHEVNVTEQNYCVECNMQFTNNALYMEHLKFSVKHRPTPIIPCPDCGKIYTKKSNMNNHYDLVHKKKTKHYCALCDTYYLNGFRLRYHQKYFHEKRPKPKNKICKYCGKGFSANRILENHVRTHTGERPFACTFCTAAFSQKQALTSHMKSAHK